MTEPPEPRRPEEDGGEEPEDLNAYEGEMDGVDRDAAREFVQDSTPDMQDAIDAARERYGDEQFDAMVEEVLRRANERGEDDFLGEAEDDMLLDELGGSGDLPLGENSELSDMLGAWRDDVESEPVPPIAERAQEIHELNQQYDAPPTSGGTPNMSASEEAARLRQVAEDTAAAGALQELISRLEESMYAVQGALGADHSKLADALGPFEAANSAALELQGIIAAAYENLSNVAGQIG